MADASDEMKYLDSFEIICTDGMKQVTHCLNCDTELVGDYCHACGQRAVQYAGPLREIYHELIRPILTFDNRFFRSVGRLISSPGALSEAYLAGQRRRFSSPLQLYLATSLVWFSILAIPDSVYFWNASEDIPLTPDATEEVANDSTQISLTPADTTQTSTSVETEPLGYLPTDVLGIQKRMEDVRATQSASERQASTERARRTFSRTLFGLMPVFALVLLFTYIGTGRFYIQHLVFSAHTHAMLYLVLALSSVVEESVTGLLKTILMWVLFFGFAFHTYVALHRVYPESWWLAGLRFIFVAMVYGLIFIAILGITVLLPLLL